jgi:adenine-specific DNA-methyltransferase
MARTSKSKSTAKEPKNYNHAEEHPQRPDIGTEPHFKKKKPPTAYRYDSSLAPELSWDENPAREQAEALIAKILESESLEEIKAAASQLKALGQPFLNWSGKAERESFDVPTLPLFVHERLSTRAIIETLKSHKVGGDQLSLFELFSDPQWSISDQILKAYEYHDKWVNRMILGDSLIVMNSLLQYEGMGGKVQMIYIDPPYGVKFGSNFQPFVRKRDVSHNDDNDFTREPEMVQAYRDTWELGLHSYLSYLRDRLLLARDLLTDSSSVFVQIGEENVHHVRELMDETFGSENFCRLIPYITTSFQADKLLANTTNYLLWYAKKQENIKVRSLFRQKQLGDSEAGEYKYLLLRDGSTRTMTKEEKSGMVSIPEGSKAFRYGPLTSQGFSEQGSQPFEFQGNIYKIGNNQHWKTSIDGLKNLAKKNLLIARVNSLSYFMFLHDFPVSPITNVWTDTKWGFDAGDKRYVVETNIKVIERCLLMTTDPGDLVLDLTCGSGTTAYVAEQWGRRWITCDVSRVPLALARQRLLTATFPWYQLRDGNSPASGFVYKRKQNKKGEEVGGIVPHITLKSIANNEPPAEEILVDRPETDNSIVRVCSPFTIEGTIPPPVDRSGEESPETEDIAIESSGSYEDRMLEILKKSPVLRLPGNRTINLTQIRQPAKSQNLSAEALVKASELDGTILGDVVDEALKVNLNKLPLSQKPVAFIFGPENGAIAERTVYEAAKEAERKDYAHLFIIGFAIAAKARQFVEDCQTAIGIPATYIQATPDLLMGDLLKHMRSSQIFSVCGLPDVKVHKIEEGKYQVELLGLDVFDPITMKNDSTSGNDVPAWFLDTDYNGLCFHVNQAFFPRTGAWDSLKKALKGTYDDEVWEHLAGTLSAPFDPGEHQEIAVKVIDDRGNELLVVKSLKGE